MAFKIPNEKPTKYSSFEEWADYAEYQVLKTGQKIRLQSIFFDEVLTSDEELVKGINDDTDLITEKGEELVAELAHRMQLLGYKYPFELDKIGYTLRLKDSQSILTAVYRFFLLATRLNMKTDRTQNQLDGTLIFEELASFAVKNYFGDRARALVFGTSVEGGFRSKLAELVKEMGEGGIPKSNPMAKPKDDKVDIVVWSQFADKKSSKFIAFGQCKTGTEWYGDLEKLNTTTFCNKWFTNQPLVAPYKFFCCTQYFPRERWETDGYSAGLIFDRFRLLDCLDSDLPQDLLLDMAKWSDGAERVG